MWALILVVDLEALPGPVWLDKGSPHFFMRQSELEAALRAVRDGGFDESFVRFCARTFSSHTYPSKNLAAARMHAHFLRLALEMLCNDNTKAGVLLGENSGTYDVNDPETLCLQLARECYHDAMKGEVSFCELFIMRWCDTLADR